MKIPSEITREHILKALASIDAGSKHRWSPSRKYILVHDGRSYAPKAVLGLAICDLKGCDQYAFDFSGGSETNGVLERLGFTIVEKNPSEGN